MWCFHFHFDVAYGKPLYVEFPVFFSYCISCTAWSLQGLCTIHVSVRNILHQGLKSWASSVQKASSFPIGLVV